MTGSRTTGRAAPPVAARLLAAALSLSVSSTLLLAGATVAHAQVTDYYAGKRLVVLVNYAAGGPADIEARFFARHLARHLTGNTGVIVQNMDGAGGMVGAVYVGEVAPKDGTLLGMLTASAWQFATEIAQRKVPFRSYEFVASQPSTTVYFGRTDIKPSFKQPADLGKAQGLVVGGLAADSSKDILLRLTLDMLGHKYKYVTGYRGSNAARLAMQQGEINFYSESPPSYRTVVTEQLIAKGDAIGVFYDPGWDGKVFSRSNQVDGLTMPAFHELYKEIRGELPKGQLWDTYLTALAVTGELFRVAVLPPGVPKAAVESLQAAIRKLATDKEFADEAMKAFSYVPEFDARADVGDKVRRMIDVSPQLKTFLADYVKAGSASR